MAPRCGARLLCASFALALFAGRATADDVAAAEALFQEGRRLMESGEFARACPKLEESNRLDPGTGTLWHLGRCYRETGRLASAWAKYHELAALARRGREPAKVKAALRAARKIEPELHKLVINVPGEARVEGLRVVRNGTEIGPGAWGTEVPVDRGTHRIRAGAPAHERWSTEVTIEGPASTTRVEVPALERKRRPAKASGPDDPGGGAGESPPPQDIGPWYGDRLGWALALGGAALAAAGGGALVQSSSLAAKADRQVDLAERDRLLDDAAVYRASGGTLLVVGGGALAAGVVKLALHPKGAETREPGTQAWIQVGSGATLIGVAGDF